MAQADLQPRTALIVLTALNLLNYVDRNVLFAVQPLVQDEFHVSNAQIGYLTSAFLGFLYDCGALRGAAGGSLLAQTDHRIGSNLLERADAAHRRHTHLHRAADPAHAGRCRRGDVRHHCADVRGRSVR